jgi:preprotein translocase subunit YajC
MNQTTLNYISFICDRALSGIANGLFYAGSAWAWPILILLFVFTVFMTWRNLRKNWGEMKRWKRVLAVLGVVASGVSVLMVGLSFRFPHSSFSEIHLWTWLGQTAIASTMFVSSKRFWKNLWWLALAVSPSVFLQKLFVNVFGGSKWNYAGTDDKTGKTWGFSLFGKRFKVPRVADWWVRLILSVVCIAAFITVSVVRSHRDKKSEQTEIIRA